MVRLDVEVRVLSRVREPLVLHVDAVLAPVDDAALVDGRERRVNHDEDVGVMLVPEIMDARMLLRDVVGIIPRLAQPAHQGCLARCADADNGNFQNTSPRLATRYESLPLRGKLMKKQ